MSTRIYVAQVFPDLKARMSFHEDSALVLELLSQPQGVHEKFYAKMQPLINKMHRFASDVRAIKRRRTMPSHMGGY